MVTVAFPSTMVIPLGVGVMPTSTASRGRVMTAFTCEETLTAHVEPVLFVSD